jgi:hypothetical protein
MLHIDYVSTLILVPGNSGDEYSGIFPVPVFTIRSGKHRKIHFLKKLHFKWKMLK